YEANGDWPRLMIDLYIRKKMYGAAIQELDRSIAADPTPFRYQRRAEVHFRLKHYPEVLADLTKVAELNPAGFNDLGWLKSSDARQREALLEVARKAIEKAPESPEAYRMRARLYGVFGEPDKAKADLEKV